MFKNSAKFNLTDFSVMLFTVVIALCYVFQHGTARDVVFERILGCVFVYLSVRLICSIFPKTINYAVLLFITGYSLFEAYKGLLQLLGNVHQTTICLPVPVHSLTRVLMVVFWLSA